ncbi:MULTISPECIES: ABC transporter ATP-binding protein [Mumia]|uniref:ABC transporter ATP-binding protein n=1 Tax=Mumia TaxID=1546255 RepID=UPI0014245E48|nr:MULTISPECIES: ABC transporter ATP-binding protein [unclassified Mumia]QMW65306.1 ABC transporter ATP-binding protein [Mumia sp. ZJ1417]
MTAPATPALEIRSLGLRIGGATILEGIDLAVDRGSMVGIIGPNGAGKTTLFNAVSGLITPTDGSVLLDGKDITTMPVASRARAGLGRTFQTSSLFPDLSVLENVRLAAQVSRGGSLSVVRFPRRTDAATKAALDHLDEVGLADKVDVLAGGLSHGDKRKLEIAMLLASHPSVILLDEPMAGVGSGDVAGLSAIIHSLHRDKGCTVLMVEHHMDVLLGLVDKVAVLHFGHVLAYDTPSAVMADPTVQNAYLGTNA